jgi:hypothetical protein
MPEPLSVTAGVWCLGYAALAAYARGSSAISAEAQAARRSACAVLESAERSHALFGGKAAAISELMSLSNECSEPGWDGDAAAAVDPVAVAAAQEFVRVMPEDVLLPEFAAEPDGSISLDWVRSRHRRFTLSIGGSNRLAYAWLDGADKGHGVARFDGTHVPPRVLEGIRSIMNHADASLRAA